MTPRLIIRPVLACLAAGALSACGMVDSDPHRFENLAETVAAIPLDGPAADAPAPIVHASSDTRPAPLKVEVLDPHALWDARDGGLGDLASQQGPRLVAAAAPAAAEAVLQKVSARVDAALAPTARPAPATAPRGPSRLVQIGAYSSEAAARTAWSRLADRGALDGLTPVFEAVEVGGRRLTRRKVRAPEAGAAAICAAAGIDDPWCRRAG